MTRANNLPVEETMEKFRTGGFGSILVDFGGCELNNIIFVQSRYLHKYKAYAKIVYYRLVKQKFIYKPFRDYISS
jgi:hypothetical protein